MSSENNPFAPSQIDPTDAGVNLQDPNTILILRKHALAIRRIGWMSIAISILNLFLFGTPWLYTFFVSMHGPPWAWHNINHTWFVVCLTASTGVFLAGVSLLQARSRSAIIFAIVTYIVTLPFLPILGVYSIIKLLDRKTWRICSREFRAAHLASPPIDGESTAYHRRLTLTWIFVIAPLSQLICSIIFALITDSFYLPIP